MATHCNVKNISYKKAQRDFKRLAGGGFLYCLFFSHGLMKVGFSSREYRLDEILSFGLLEPLLVDHVVAPCGDKSPSNAESIALKRLRKIAGAPSNQSNEVFFSIKKDSVKKELILSIESADQENVGSRSMEHDYSDIAQAGSMYGAFLWEAKSNMFPLAWWYACEYVIRNEGVSVDQFESGLEGLHWLTLELVKPAIEENIKLIAKGASRALRRELLQASVEQMRAKRIQAEA